MLHLERRGDVVILRMDDGKVNAMGPAFVDAFQKGWTEATKDEKPVVLAGNARAFCAGLDLKKLPELGDQIVPFARGFMSVFRDVLAYRRPTIAAVDGAAPAGGTVLALACDLRVVSPRARMGVTEVPVGVPFPDAVLDLVAHKVPPPESHEAILKGTMREGADCLARGWAHRFAPEGACVDEAVMLASELGGMSPHAYAQAKARLNRDVLAQFDRFVRDGAPAWVAELDHPDTKAALARTLAKLRRP